MSATEPTPTLAELRARGLTDPIRIYQDAYQDESGEYMPADSWSGTKLLADSDDYGMRVELVVRVDRNRSVVSARVGLRNHPRTEQRVYGLDGVTGHKKIATAVETWRVSHARPYVIDAIRAFCAPAHATCLYRVHEDLRLEPVCTSWEPFALIAELRGDHFLGVSVEYETRRPRRYHLHFVRYRRFGSGRSAGPWDGPRDPSLYWLWGGLDPAEETR